MRLQCDVSGFQKAQGHPRPRSVCKWEWEWVWMVGALAGRAGSQLGQRAGVPGWRGHYGRAAQGVAVRGRRERVAGGGVGWLGRQVLAPARNRAAALISFLPSAARPDRGRPETEGAPRARVRRGRAPCSLPGGCCRGPPGLSPPLLCNCPRSLQLHWKLN